MTKPKGILLTGATGHLGAAIAAEMLSRGEEGRLRLLIRSPEKLRRLLALGPRFEGLADCGAVIGDIRDPEILATALKGVEAVIHACHSHEYWRGTNYILDVNLEGARRLAETAATAPGVRDIFYIGSYSVHDSISGPDREELKTRSARAASSAVKATAQQILRGAASSGGYRLHVVSPSYMLGPYQLDPTYLGALFHLVQFRPLTWYPPNGINLIDVRDVARLVVDRVVSGDGDSRSELASGDDVSYLEIFTAANRAAGHDVVPQEIPAKLMRRMPRLRLFGDFGKLYFENPHYIARPGLSGRNFTLEDTITDTVTFAGCNKLYKGTLHLGFSLARRYL